MKSQSPYVSIYERGPAMPELRTHCTIVDKHVAITTMKYGTVTDRVTIPINALKELIEAINP